MNGLDIIIYTLSAGALFLLFIAGYSLGHKDGKREGYARGRDLGRIYVKYDGVEVTK